MAKSNNKSFVQKKNKQLIIIAVVLVAIIGVSYAWLTATLVGEKTNQITAGTLQMTLDDSASTGIQLLDTVPMSDSKADELTGDGKEYTFTVKNTGNIAAQYSIYLDDQPITEGAKRLENDKIKTELTIDGTATKLLLSGYSGAANAKVLDAETLAPNASKTYKLKMWIDSSATNSDLMDVVAGKNVAREYSGKLRLEASQTGIPSGTNVDYTTGQTTSGS